MVECSRCGIFNDNDALACKRCGLVLTPVKDISNDKFNIIPIKYKRINNLEKQKTKVVKNTIIAENTPSIVITNDPMTNGKIVNEVEMVSFLL